MCVGTDPKLPFFIVSAHYDHVGIRDGHLSGRRRQRLRRRRRPRTGGVLPEVAVPSLDRVCGVRRGGARLAGREGVPGQPPVPKERIGPNVNLDMVSRSDKRELFVAGTYHYPGLKAPLDDVARRAPITVLFGHDKPVAVAGGVEDWTNQSDHGPFHDAKVPFVYFGVEDHADYHKPTDTADKINHGLFVDVAETILDSVLALDRARETVEQQLFDAIKGGRIDEVKQLVAETPTLKQARDGSGASAILVAAYNMEAGRGGGAHRGRCASRHFRSERPWQGRSHQEILKGAPGRVTEFAPDGFTPVALAAFFGQLDGGEGVDRRRCRRDGGRQNPLKVQASARGRRQSQPGDRESRSRRRRRPQRAAAGGIPCRCTRLARTPTARSRNCSSRTAPIRRCDARSIARARATLSSPIGSRPPDQRPQITDFADPGCAGGYDRLSRSRGATPREPESGPRAVHPYNPRNLWMKSSARRHALSVERPSTRRSTPKCSSTRARQLRRMFFAAPHSSTA